MSFMKSAIFSKSPILENLNLSFLDIGARGDLPSPWVQLERRAPERLNVVGFETDSDELLKLQKKFPHRSYLQVGLSSEDGEVDFYLNRSKSTSSLFRPNEKTSKKFDDKHSLGRVVEKTTSVGVSKVDSLDLSSFKSAFVKLDVQGAELDILNGAKNFFATNVIGFSAETWTYEVYKNQPLIHEVMKWANENGYEIYGLEESGRWDFRSSRSLRQRGAPVCVDLLYFKSFEKFFSESPSLNEIILFALALDLWGFPSRALSLLQCHVDQSDVEKFAQLIKCSGKRPWFSKHKLNDFVDKIYTRFGLTPYFPPIHD